MSNYASFPSIERLENIYCNFKKKIMVSVMLVVNVFILLKMVQAFLNV